MIYGPWGEERRSLTLALDGRTVTEKAASLRLTEDMNGGGGSVTVGAAAAAVLRLELLDPKNSYAGKRLTAKLGDTPLGVFTVTSAEMKDGRAVIEAMDALATDFGGGYFPERSDSTALRVIREICAQCGAVLGSTAGIADVPVTGLRAGCTCRETLGHMAALLGRNARMDRYGRLVLRWYAPAEALTLPGVTVSGERAAVPGVVAGQTLFPEASEDPASVTADRYYAGQLAAGDGDAAVTAIACTVTRTLTASETGEDGGVTVTEEQTTETLTAGSGEPVISIVNPYMTRDRLERVLAGLGSEPWRPMTVTFYGDARIEAGDVLRVTDGTGAVLRLPVMRAVHQWDGGLRTTVTALDGAEAGLRQTGSLTEAVDRMTAELGLFKTLEARNLETVSARIRTLRADQASLGELVADKADVTALNAATADIEDLRANKADVTSLNAVNASVEALRAGKADVTALNAAAADIEDLRANKADMTSLNAVNASVEELRAGKADVTSLNAATARIGDLEADSLTVHGSLQAEALDIESLKANKADVTALNAAAADIEDLRAGKADVTALSAAAADIESLKANKADIAVLEADYITAERLAAVYATIANLRAVDGKFDNLGAGYAQLDFANVDLAKLRQGFAEDFFVAGGLVTEDATAVSLDVTKYLTGVTIRGDVIQAATVRADRLILTGADGLVYELNVSASGLSRSELAAETYRQKLDGSVLAAKSVTADQIKASTITGGEIAGNTITGGNIRAGSVTGASLAAGTIRGSHIAGGTITARNLLVGDYQNYVTVTEAAAETMLPADHVYGGTEIGNGAVRKAAAANDLLGLSDPEPSSFVCGDQLYYELTAWAGRAGAAYLTLYGYDGAGNPLGGFRSGPIGLTASARTFSGTLYLSDMEPVTGAAETLFLRGAASGETYLLDAVLGDGYDGAGEALRLRRTMEDWKRAGLALSDTAGRQVYVKNASVRRKSAGSLIVDGAITAEKLRAGSVTADKLSAGAVTADKLSAGAVTADKLSVTDLRAVGAQIGGFTIGQTGIHRGMTALDDRSHDGVYLGTDGIALGRGAFRVDDDGALTAADADLTGLFRNRSEVSGEEVEIQDGHVTLWDGTGATRGLVYTNNGKLRLAAFLDGAYEGAGVVLEGGAHVRAMPGAAGDLTVDGDLTAASLNGVPAARLGEKPVLLWENGDPESAFAAQHVSVPGLGDYGVLLFSLRTGSYYETCAVFAGDRTLFGTVLRGGGDYAGGGWSSRRVVVRRALERMTFDGGWTHTPGGTVDDGTLSMGGHGADNDACVPLAIHGVKLIG